MAKDTGVCLNPGMNPAVAILKLMPAMAVGVDCLSTPFAASHQLASVIINGAEETPYIRVKLQR